MPKQPCLECGRVIEQNKWARCLGPPLYCARPHIEQDDARRRARQRTSGRQRRDVRRAMQQAIDRDGCCVRCGRTDGLTAHYIPHGVHSADPTHYEALCRSCHGKLDGGRRDRT